MTVKLVFTVDSAAVRLLMSFCTLVAGTDKLTLFNSRVTLFSKRVKLENKFVLKAGTEEALTACAAEEPSRPSAWYSKVLISLFKPVNSALVSDKAEYGVA